MKFPITRESLQAFCPEKYKAEQREIAIENHVNSLLNTICNKLKNSITSLSDYTGMDYYFKKEHEETQKNTLIEKRFIYKLEYINKQASTNLIVESNILIERLVYKLTETFIGCDIIVDPLKTYIIIDWS